jgi:hypothetical protein
MSSDDQLWRWSWAIAALTLAVVAVGLIGALTIG